MDRLGRRSPSPPSPLRQGQLVSVTGHALSIGKVTALGGEFVDVAFFTSVGVPPQAAQVHVRALKPHSLARQTRCYFLDEATDTWRIGRVFRQYGAEYEVDLPDGRSVFVPESALYVRCDAPIDDPIDTLAMKGHETPFFHDRRAAFVSSLLAQRAAARGMTGLLSANVDLLPHQVEVVRRVTEDPIQRYLLADEVGLGKTIEAGAILRQFLLDHRSGMALVLVPEALVGQWEREMAQKFAVARFGERVAIRAIETLNEATVALPWGMVVIDEAHHVADDPALYERCRRLAHASERLLLLSATPVLNHEQDFLAMLHLLDPLTYALDDLEGFRERLAKRQDVGHLLLGLQEDAPTFILESNAAELRACFPHDARLVAMSTELEAAAVADAAAASMAPLLRAIRAHLSDTYRLHRRLLRNRRREVNGLSLARDASVEAGPFREEYDLDERPSLVHEVLDQWRLDAGAAADSWPSHAAGWRLVGLTLFQAAGTWLGLLEACTASRLDGKVCPRVSRAFGLDAARAVADTPAFDGELEGLEALRAIARQEPEEGDRAAHLRDVLDRLVRQRVGMRAVKIVVFTAYAETGRAIADVLIPRFGEQLACHLEDQAAAETEAAMERFRDKGDCQILLCDPSGEEGLNLQHADWLVHFDLPWAPNRLEQRIGRLDRIGRRHELGMVVFPGPETEDSPWDAWYRVLREGFRVFDESVASLQYYIEAKAPDLEAALFEGGSADLGVLVAEVKADIADQRTRIEEQNVLDAIDAQDAGADEHFQAMRTLESQPDALRIAFEEYALSALHFRRTPAKAGSVAVHYEPTSHTLVPSDLVTDQFVPVLDYPVVYSRGPAGRREGASLMRVGDALVDVFASYVRWDDRGQAFALWRTIPGWLAQEGEEWLGFRFDFVVEADLEGAIAALAATHPSADHQALGRRADALFPPAFETLYLDNQLQPVTDPAVIAQLARPYEKRHEDGTRDTSLAKSRLPILDMLVPGGWEDWCRQARHASEDALRTRPEFVARCDEQAEAAARRLAERTERLSLRLDRLKAQGGPGQKALEADLTLETALSHAMVDGIRRPRMRLDSVGFYVLSGRAPGIGVDDE